MRLSVGHEAERSGTKRSGVKRSETERRPDAIDVVDAVDVVDANLREYELS